MEPVERCDGRRRYGSENRAAPLEEEAQGEEAEPREHPSDDGGNHAVARGVRSQADTTPVSVAR